MNRNHAKAEAGWSIFLARNPRPSRDAINQELEAQGLPGIADRTYRHYRELAGAGFAQYLPINDFDMWRKHRRDPGPSSN